MDVIRTTYSHDGRVLAFWRDGARIAWLSLPFPDFRRKRIDKAKASQPERSFSPVATNNIRSWKLSVSQAPPHHPYSVLLLELKAAVLFADGPSEGAVHTP